MKAVLKTVDASNLSIVLGISKENASFRISRLKKKYKKPPHSILTLSEFCKWNGLDEEEMTKYFN